MNIERIGEIIREVAAAEVMPRWQKLEKHEILEKTGPKDLVTVADRACEKALAPRLVAELAGSVVVGEEGVEADASVYKQLEGGQLVWVIDPVDGTMAFSEGRREFDVMVALTRGKELLAGWIYSPTDDDLYMAEKGSGILRSHRLPTTGDAKPLPISPAKIGNDIKDFSGILGRANFSEEQRNALKTKQPHFKKWLPTVCAGHDYTRLVRGEAQFAVYNKCMAWDHAPGLALLQEIGFKFARFDGSPYRLSDPSGGLLIVPSAQWEEIQRLLFQ
ncbi:MAG TPA: inositol monophosphatase [Alphaproteobacteria bacterium]|nr:inositol monophosphatase [Alphaproteobacteria bacterium]